jgi:hypothetical protein
MDRDFTCAGVQKLLGIVEDERDEKLWKELIIGDLVTDPFSKEMDIPNNVAEMESYHRNLIDKKNYGRNKMQQLLRDVKFVDGKYKAQFELNKTAITAFSVKIQGLANLFSIDNLNSDPEIFNKSINNILKNYNEEYRRIHKELNANDILIFLSRYLVLDSNGNITGVKISEILDLISHPEKIDENVIIALSLLWDYIKAHESEIEAAVFKILKTILPGLPFLDSFEYDENNDYYYTNKTGAQSHLGFSDSMEEELGKDAQLALGMDLNDDEINFSANGKSYDLRLWKGSYGYGNAYGAEIGLYVNEDNEDTAWKPCASENDQLKMSVKIYEKGTGKLLTYNDNQNDEHFWNLTIDTNLGNPYNKDNIYVEYSVTIEDATERNELFKKLRNSKSLGLNQPIGNVRIEGNTIYFTWGNEK